MDVKKQIKLFEHVQLFVNDERLNDEQKNKLISFLFGGFSFLREKKLETIKQGYIIDGILFIIRKKTKRKQSKRWYEINKKMNDIVNRKICIRAGITSKINKIKLIDTKNQITIDLDNVDLRSILYDTLGLYYSVILENQYEVSSDKIKNKIVIDAGSNLGEFSLYCARLGAKKVYAFEPVTKTYNLLKKQIKANKLEKKIIPIKKALGENNKISFINFGPSADGGASIIFGKDNKNKEEIEVIKLDDFIPEKEKISFIKMDVEGYEKNVLLGAKEIIFRDKPILSFSAYHNPEDKKVLPAIVKSIRKDYRIRLMTKAEEDFYCD